jgi:hypothetical protein
VSVPEVLESDESFVIQGWRPDSEEPPMWTTNNRARYDRSSSPGWIAHRCSLLRPCALRPRSFRRPPLDVDGCYEPFKSRPRGLAADPHAADPPAMAVPETLRHPFATTKIVVWPGTCSVRGGPIAARSRDAWGDTTLCACGRSSERTSDCCDHDGGSKYLLHFGVLLQMNACQRIDPEKRSVNQVAKSALSELAPECRTLR